MVFLGLQKVMLVDSDGDVSPQCERVLKRCGVTEIIRARNLRIAGSRLANTEAIDFILVDVDLNELRGESISSLLLEGGSSNASNVPTLFIAGVKTRAEVQELQDAGCYNFLMKPLNDNLLEARIREILERSFDSTKELEIITEVKTAITEMKLSEAEAILKPVLRKYPTSHKFQTLLAEIVFYRNDIRTALAITEKVLKGDAGFQPAAELKRLIQNKINLEKEAEIQAKNAAEKAKIEKDLQAKKDLAKHYTENRQYDRAEGILLELLSQTKNTATYFPIQLELAKTYFAEKKFDKAKATIADLQRASPKDLISEIEALLAQITHEEEILAEEKAQKGYAYAELAKATDFPLPEGATATDFDAQEEERILKYIMFEGKL